MINKKYNTSVFKKKIALLCAVFFCSTVYLLAQNGAPKPASKRLESSFLETDIELGKNDIINNVLRVVNNSKAVARFTIELGIPDNWKALGKTGKLYEVNPHDSVFIPVVLIPTVLIKGNTYFSINAFLVSEEGSQLNDAYFLIHLKKIIKWELNIGPSENIYFLHNQKTAAFNVNILNLGNERQEILLSTSNTSNNIVLTDTLDRVINKKLLSLNLKQQHDSTLYFKMGYFEGYKRNSKRIDADNYQPTSITSEKKYTLNVETQQSSISSNVYKVKKQVNFISLSDQKNVNQYGGHAIPLIAELNINNLTGTQPIMNLVLRGYYNMANKSYFTYYSQSDYTTYNINNNNFNNNIFNVGYFHPRKGNVQIGTVSGFGLPISGRGISGNYNITDKVTVGAFVSGDPIAFNPQRKLSYGFSHNVIFRNQQTLLLQYSHSDDKITASKADFYSFRTTFRVLQAHYLSVGATHTVNNSSFSFFPQGTLSYLNYHGGFFNNKLQLNLNETNHTQYTSGNTNKSFSLSNRMLYMFSKKYNLILQNNYSQLNLNYLKNNESFLNKNTTLYNQLFFSNNSNTGRFSPSIYFNAIDIYKVRSHSRGVGVDFSSSDPNSKIRYGVSMKAGANNFIDIKNSPEFFTFQFSSFLLYETVSFRGRYYYGSQSASDTSILSSRLNYPQTIFLSLQHQYQFANPRFVLQSSLNYSVENQYNRQSFGIYPELHYATPTGWHLKMLLSYNVNSSNFQNTLQNTNTGSFPSAENASASKITSSYSIGLGIRKEFNIPIPQKFSKEKFTDIEFVAFYDVNGNHKRDNGEALIENIIIRLGSDEVLTNENGSVILRNVKMAKYMFSTVSLVDLKGWFSALNDSLLISNQKIQYVPFVKGVKVYGNIFVDRTKYASDLEQALDLSGIKITAKDGITLETRTGKDGDFVFYAPYGTYTLIMDESILGHRYILGKNNIEITLKEGMESLYNSFYISEKKRTESIKKFDANGQEIKEK